MFDSDPGDAHVDDDGFHLAGVCVPGDPAPAPEGALDDERIAGRLGGIEAGPRLASWIALIDVSVLDAARLVLVAAARERQRRFDAAWDHGLLAALHHAPVDAPDDTALAALHAKGSPDPQLEWRETSRAARADLLAAIIGMAPGTASRRIAAAVQLAPGGRLAATGQALADGHLPESCARLIADTLESVDDDLAAGVQAAVLPTAATLPYRKLDSALKRAIARLRPVQEEIAHLQARRLRRIGRLRPLEAGMASLEAYGPAEDIAALWTAIDALGLKARTAANAAARAAARAASPDSDSEPVSLDAHRFDALIALACGALTDPDLPKRQGRRPSIQVTVAASTLLDLDDQPGELTGYGPIAAETARRIAADDSATWRRILTDPAGRAIDYGTTTYRPPQDLIDAIIARDITCVFPGCSRPAREAEIDHQIPYPQGPTAAWNMQPLCPNRHHKQKTLGIWTPRLNQATGSTTWTHRTGLTATRHAHTMPPAPTRPLQDIAALLKLEPSTAAPAAQAQVPAHDDPPPF